MNAWRLGALLAVAYGILFAVAGGLLRVGAQGFAVEFTPLGSWIVPGLLLALAVALWRGWRAGWWGSVLVSALLLWQQGSYQWMTWRAGIPQEPLALAKLALLLALLLVLLGRPGRRRALG